MNLADGLIALLQRFSSNPRIEPVTPATRSQVENGIEDRANAFWERIEARQRAAIPVSPNPPPVIRSELTTFSKSPSGGAAGAGSVGPTGPAGSGTQGPPGTVPDGAITIINDGESFVAITGSISGGVITLNFAWDTTDCS